MQVTEFIARKRKIGVIGLGYVGLPLLIAFEKYYDMIGFDISAKKIDCLLSGLDDTAEVGDTAIQNSTSLFTNNPAHLRECDILIVAVPTPIDEFKIPNLEPIIKATACIAENLKKGAVIVYESTVYPGVTEELCRPILTKAGHIYQQDFFLAYSPERINPGDHEHRFENILKIVSGDTPETLQLVADIYRQVVKTGVFPVSSIKVAEAAKVIENTQRDVNIALMNELAMVFAKIGIDTQEVLEAAGTKWNFIRMKPGLVGGHCIGVDPYYLTYKAEQLGYHPEIITSGRRINDNMARYVAMEGVKKMIQIRKTVYNARVLVLGVTFKENCPDTRNSKIADLIAELKSFSCQIFAFDPYVKPPEIEASFGAKYFDIYTEQGFFDAVFLAVTHNKFHTLDLSSFFQANEQGVFMDIRSCIPRNSLPEYITHWRL